MKFIKDFIYNISDIFITLLVVALASGIIIWRVQVIMSYSDYVQEDPPKNQIDIDFTDVDLTIEDEPDPNNKGGENKQDVDVETIVVDENFTAYKTIYVTVSPGDTYDKAIRLLASEFKELDATQYAVLYSLLWNTGNDYGAESRVQIGSFTIEQGTSIANMVNIICGGQLF